MARDLISEKGCVSFEPPEWLSRPDELGLGDGVLIPNTSTSAAPGAVPEQGGVFRVFGNIRSDD